MRLLSYVRDYASNLFAKVDAWPHLLLDSQFCLSAKIAICLCHVAKGILRIRKFNDSVYIGAMKKNVMSKLTPVDKSFMSFVFSFWVTACHICLGLISPKCKWGERREVPNSSGKSRLLLYSSKVESKRISSFCLAVISPGCQYFCMLEYQLILDNNSRPFTVKD